MTKEAFAFAAQVAESHGATVEHAEGVVGAQDWLVIRDRDDKYHVSVRILANEPFRHAVREILRGQVVGALRALRGFPADC